jgi:threonylcarbamoyladenosine tRNA methylthiotransferase MtaB
MSHRNETPFKVAVATVGCRANQADSAFLARYLDRRFVEVTASLEGADLVVVNTCCVTAEAERDCRKQARRALTQSPDARVVFVGCAVNAAVAFGDDLKGRVEKRGGEDADPRKLAAWINTLAGAPMDTRSAAEPLEPLGGRTRALIKIQNGCSHNCAYCIVPRARGKERSMPEEEVLTEIDQLAQSGFREVVVTGVQLGAWGSDLKGPTSLARLVEKAADRIAPGRLRLSSVEPWSVDRALIEVTRDHDRVCPHLHLPLQNGDDRILETMRREYTREQYLDLVSEIRDAVPDIAIGTDVILGFPGEDEEAFNNTVETLERMQPAYLHAFSFSPRPGTDAAKLPGRVDKETVKERTRKVRALGEEHRRAFVAAHQNQTREVIVEENQDGRWKGLTDTFVKVIFEDPNQTPGSLVKKRLKLAVDSGALVARR